MNVPRGRAAAASPAVGSQLCCPTGSCDGDGDGVGSQGSETAQGEHGRAQGLESVLAARVHLCPQPHSSLCRGRKGNDLWSHGSVGVFSLPVFNFVWR